jgi:hypothetical protein
MIMEGKRKPAHLGEMGGRRLVEVLRLSVYFGISDSVRSFPEVFD